MTLPVALSVCFGCTVKIAEKQLGKITDMIKSAVAGYRCNILVSIHKHPGTDLQTVGVDKINRTLLKIVLKEFTALAFGNVAKLCQMTKGYLFGVMNVYIGNKFFLK